MRSYIEYIDIEEENKRIRRCTMMKNKIFLNESFEFGGTVKHLFRDKGNYAGVYIVVLPNDFIEISFSESCNLSLWRDKVVSVSIEELEDKWVNNCEILYIGKSESKTVNRRMHQHINFWNGKPVAAFGGRIIGQINNYENLEVWFLECDNPKNMEEILIKRFRNKYGKLPFANWRI